MSTFETVQRRIVNEMNAVNNPDSITWANIMLNHTSRLTDVNEQKKFWNWFTNPGDKDLPVTDKWVDVPAVDLESLVTVPLHDEEKGCIELENSFRVNGLATYVSTKPRTERQTLKPLRLDHLSVSAEDEKSPE